ncbi:MAG: polysaccharide deacetylase family protein [Pseudomonadales bacterium]|nr:polysaccharide deacetylase family protein [Pseudomonadales bacterium]
MSERACQPLRALVSIHDVMPETRPQVEAMLEKLALPASAVTLLVVPGRDWRHDDLAWLHKLQDAGHPLAGHGWSHRCQPPVTLYHRLHSALLSRDVAEHLSFSGDGIQRLVWDCYRWFLRHGLTPSPLYVPPAWALGALSQAQLAGLPFRYVETLTGVHDTHEQHFTRLPLLGFEADTAFRAWVLRLFNAINISQSRRSGVPVRIGLHPHDFQLRLAGEIPPLIKAVTEAVTYPQVLTNVKTDPGSLPL